MHLFYISFHILYSAKARFFNVFPSIGKRCHYTREFKLFSTLQSKKYFWSEFCMIHTFLFWLHVQFEFCSKWSLTETIMNVNINKNMISIYAKGLSFIFDMINLHILEIRLLMSDTFSINDCRNQYFQRKTRKQFQNTWIRLLWGWIGFLIGITMEILYIWFVFWLFIPFNTKLISNWIKKKWISSLYHVFISLIISHNGL